MSLFIKTRASRRPKFVLCLAVLVISLAALSGIAYAEGSSVRYSYERISMPGGDHFALVPIAEHKALGGKLSKKKVFDAFNLLKSAKKSNYGHSSIQVTGTLPDKATVSVKIDRSMAKKGLAPIIMAETVYTLSELGLQGGVEFPGHYSGKMTRKDVPFVAFTLTVPLWRAVSEEGLSAAQILLPDGEMISSAEFSRGWKAKDPKLVEAFFAYLKSGEDFTVTQVLGVLSKLDLEFVDQVVPLLEAESTAVRRHALRTLAPKREEARVLQAVQGMVRSEEDQALARSAAEFLGKSKAPEFAIEEPLYLLEKGKDDEAVAAIGKLVKDFSAVDAVAERVVEAVVAHLGDKRAPVAAESAKALGKIGEPSRQVEALKDPKIDAELRLLIAEELASNSDDSFAIIGLKYAAEHTDGRDAELKIRRLGELKSAEASDAVRGFLQAGDSRKRLAAADVLVERNEVSALPAIAQAIAKGEDADELEEAAYQLMVAQPLPTILEQSDAADKTVQRIAYMALGERAVKEGGGASVLEKLSRGAENSNAQIRGASARALGAFANDEALAVLKKLAADNDASVRTGVAQGLAHYKNGEEFDTLDKYLSDASPSVVAAALDAMAERGEAAKWNAIRELASAKDPKVRASALVALSRLVGEDDKQGVSTVISMLSGAVSDADRQVQYAALDQLGTFKDARATTGIALQLNSQQAPLRVAAVEALGKTGHPSAVELVVGVLADADADIRRAAVEALGDLKAKAAAPQLKARLEVEEDAELKKLIQKTLTQL